MKLLFLFSLVLAAHAETAVPNPSYVTIGKVETVVLKQGQAADAIIPAAVLKGHHIQANPATLPNLIATELSVEPLEGLAIGKTVYPKSKAWKLKTASKTIQTYEGDLVLKINLTSTTLKSGNYEVKGSLRYQACDEKNCFFPTSTPVVIPVTVVK
ncbi:MAG: protein-disulfide reductase DsbD domain-containing protein [Pseudomonadota bacterium]